MAKPETSNVPAGPTIPAEEQPVFVESVMQGDLDRLESADNRAQSPVAPVSTESPRDDSAPHTNYGDGAKLSEAPPEVSAPNNRRALSLDALRGLLLVMMTIGFTVAVNMFPPWMYHRQYPGGEVFTDIPGLTWRDLAYAGFLFTMSAALPLTLSRRMAKGERDVEILIAILRRGFMLLVFALVIGHSNTFFIGYTQVGRTLALVGFVILAMVFTRRRPDWNPAAYRLVNMLGWAAAFSFLLFTPMLYGKGLDIERIDDIIVGLAFAAMVGSLVWYLTRDNINMRLAVLALSIAGYLGAKGDGWVADWWWSHTFPFFTLSQMVLMAVVIPGTIAGDYLLRWMNSSSEERGTLLYWSNARLLGLAFVCALVTPVTVIGMYNRWVPETTEIVLGLLVGCGVMVWNPRTESEKLVRRIFSWSALWLMLGLVLEPFENGIHKEPDTLSYFFTVTGLIGLLLVSFAIIVDLLKRRRWVNALIDVGHNPLLCYVLYTLLINSLLELFPPTRGIFERSVSGAIAGTLISTLVVVLIVRWTTRKRIFWRT
jgi:predicted acyltransferase